MMAAKNRKIKSILALFIVLVLAASMCRLVTADSDRVLLYAGSSKELKEKIDSCTDSDKNYVIYLTYNITLDKADFGDEPELVIPEGVKLMITSDPEDGVRYSIEQVKNDKSDLLNGTDHAMVEIYGALSLENVTLDAESNGRVATVKEGGSLILSKDAYLQNGKIQGHGGGVLLEGGALTMIGGSIQNNTAVLGGGIYISSGTADISGGVIQSNTGSHGSINADAIYFGDESETAISDVPQLRLGGNFGISGAVYLESGLYITLTKTLGNSIKVMQEYNDYGVVVAKYADGTEINAADAAKFKSAGKYGYSLDEANRSIVISVIDLAGCIVEVPTIEYDYTGSAIVPGFTVITQGGTKVTDYTYICEDMINPGEKTFVINGDGAKTDGTSTFYYTIKSSSKDNGSSDSDNNGSGSKSGTDENSSSSGSSKSSGSSSSSSTKTSTSSSTTSKTSGTTVTRNDSGTLTTSSGVLTAPESYFVKYLSDDAFTIPIENSGNGRLKFSSSETSVASVNSLGKITINGCGLTKVTVSSTATATSASSDVTVLVYVKPDTPQIRYVRATDAGPIKVSWMQEKGAAGYQIRYSVNEDMSDSAVETISDWKESEKELSSVYAGTTYYVQVRSFTVVEEKTLIGSEWSESIAVTVVQ